MQKKNFTYIRMLLAQYGLTQKDFAEKIGTSNQAVSVWINGDNGPSRATKKKILDTFPDVRELWLETGRGPMLKSQLENQLESNVKELRTEETTEAIASMVSEEEYDYLYNSKFADERLNKFPDRLKTHSIQENSQYLKDIIAEKEERIRLLEKLLKMYEERG